MWCFPCPLRLARDLPATESVGASTLGHLLVGRNLLSSLPSESTLITSTLFEHGPRDACGLPYWRDSARILWDPGGSAESKSPPSSSEQVLFLSLYVDAFDIIIFLTKDISLFLKLFFFLLPLQNINHHSLLLRYLCFLYLSIRSWGSGKLRLLFSLLHPLKVHVA